MPVVAGVAALLVGVALVLFLRGDEEPDEAEMEGLQTWSDLPNTHVEDDVSYDQAPPVGGNHIGAWMDCGAYDAPVADELAVHNLEHGGIWIAYDAAALDEAQVATLTEALPGNGILTPYDGLEAPVVVSSWERQVALDGVDDPRLAEFVSTYENSPIAPESGQVTCAGGITAEQAVQVAEQYGL
ncbi:DUF3105 domain-containing protein [Nocardioides sp.]|uniref:DUF3105 domain-containing protein n=1 Tax=Nocardioides sp. TaxID=35761 RepID=UPI002723EA23|nr:DUF3105 domain-containing protein [Nocardioides sp.]MDO9456516.1 DUF3105 domain-containing protein [Nocardioides sp.]